MARGGTDPTQASPLGNFAVCSEIDSEDLTEKRNNIVVDINLLNGAIDKSLVCKTFHSPVFCEEVEERNGRNENVRFAQRIFSFAQGILSFAQGNSQSSQRSLEDDWLV